MGKSRKRISKRFAMACYAAVSVTGITYISVFKEMESVAVIGITGLCALIYYYTKKESDNPSK